MKITLEIPDTMICAVLTGVLANGYNDFFLASYQLGSADLKDGNKITLPRTETGDSDE